MPSTANLLLRIQLLLHAKRHISKVLKLTIVLFFVGFSTHVYDKFTVFLLHVAVGELGNDCVEVFLFLLADFSCSHTFLINYSKLV